ncbi:MAG: N-6 DNA methylase [Candidatus Sumerlaeota bacterium]|nr:N-6 DNA methylase [Candidatus Sumerlaeota bacterium]
MVENTVGKLIEGKTPAQIVEMRFADIACGSGSFLLGIYDLLLRYHRDWFNARPKQAEKAGCVLRGDGAWHLSLSQRREILINNIFGVDIDHQAVEVAQLSLYLKLLEEETTASARAYQLEFPEPLLPLLNRNIVCGNSLIETDILEGHLFEPKEERKLNPMDFVDRFPHIIAENGFDAIVGNPPYGNLSSESAAPYLEKHYGIETGISDFYAVFIARCLEILKRDASVGYIVPSAWLGGPAYERFRSLCLKHSISEIISLPFDVFKDAYVDTLIVILQAGPPKPDHKVKVYAFPKKAKINNEDLHHAAFQSIRQSRWSDSEGKKFVLDAGSLDLHGKMREKISGTLADFVEIKRGVLFRKELLTDAKIAVKSYPYFEGDVYRYELNYQAPQWIVFDDQMDERPKEFKWFEGMRILLRRLVNRKQRLMAALMDKTCITNKNLYSVLVKDAALDSKFILGVLNSRLISKMYISRVSQATKDDFPQVTIKDILALPCPSPDKSCQDRMIKLVDHLMAAKKHLNNAKSDRDRDFYSNQCASFDRQIDALVYELYGLAPDEIKIVESAAV